MMCLWCKGSGSVLLVGKGRVVCPNCKGDKVSKDGGSTVTERSYPWLIGNKHSKCRGKNGRYAKQEGMVIVSGLTTQAEITVNQ